jgi:hypothetical protein
LDLPGDPQQRRPIHRINQPLDWQRMTVGDVVPSGGIAVGHLHQPGKLSLYWLGGMAHKMLRGNLGEEPDPLSKIRGLSVGMIGNGVEAIPRDKRGIKMGKADFDFFPRVQRATDGFEQNAVGLVSAFRKRGAIPGIGHV